MGMEKMLQERLHSRPVIKLATDEMDEARKEEKVQGDSESQIQLPTIDNST